MLTLVASSIAGPGATCAQANGFQPGPNLIDPAIQAGTFIFNATTPGVFSYACPVSISQKQKQNTILTSGLQAYSFGNYIFLGDAAWV